MAIFNFLKSNSNDKGLSVDLTDFKFLSDNHTRFQDGQPVNANNKGALRGIRIITFDGREFYVTMYNMSGDHPVWGNNIQMAEKQMKIIEDTSHKIILRGFGNDAMGSSFADYGLTIHKSNETINKVSLHLHDRNIDIVYEKAKNEQQTSKLDESSKKDNFDSYLKKFNSMSKIKKMQIAIKTDTINNKGVKAYNNDDIEVAIEYFLQALKVMPINDDALINLTRCYTKIGKYEESIESLNKLNRINSNNRSIIIAYSLLMHLIEDFDSDGGAVSPSTLVDFISDKFGISTNDKEMKSVIQRINEPYDRDILVFMLGGGFMFGMDSGGSPYMTSEGTTKSVIRKEIIDVLNWN